jgi:hypothetical protein
MYSKVTQALIYCVVALFSYSATAHEMTPTYPILLPSHVEGLHKTKLELFNRRSDVEYYEIGVFDKDFKSVPFATAYKILKVDYLSRVYVDVYIREDDINKALYVCSQSKLRKNSKTKAAVSSRICSKIK